MQDSPTGRRTGATNKKLGVLGTLVWDTIRTPGGELELEDWGGIAYSLTALEGTLPPEWTVVPILKVGRDLSDGALRYLDDFQCVSQLSAVTVVPEPNNRVELLKAGDGQRTEHLTGGVPGWSWTELEPHLEGLDGLYSNFISGFEMTLEVGQRLAGGFPAPTHADLHSLFLGIEASSGRRTHRPLSDALSWVRCFDSVQMNADEFGLFCEGREQPWDWVGGLVGGAPKILVVTLGSEGSAGIASELAMNPTCDWFASRQNARPVPSHFEVAAPQGTAVQGDAIGCGDVWGATFFGSFLRYGDFKASMHRANEMAKRNLTTQGTRALLKQVRKGPPSRVTSGSEEGRT
ncbi:MAG: hypothetical protein ACR2QM_06855 [Longimicrobiales bacterium]